MFDKSIRKFRSTVFLSRLIASYSRGIWGCYRTTMNSFIFKDVLPAGLLSRIGCAKTTKETDRLIFPRLVFACTFTLGQRFSMSNLAPQFHRIFICKDHWRAMLLSWTNCEQVLAILDSPPIMHHHLDDFTGYIRLHVMHQSQNFDATHFLPGLNCAASA